MTADRLEDAAGKLLAECKVDGYPVPVDQIADHLGAVVVYQPFDSDDISGLLYRTRGSAPIIGVNSTNTSSRRRFTIAHEIGHLILHEGHQLIVERHVQVNFRDSTNNTVTAAEEIEANRFAAALLMPRPLIGQALQILLEGRPLADAELVGRLRARFEVSRPAMDYRLASLGILTPS